MYTEEIRVLAKTNMTDFTKSNLVAMHLGLDSEDVRGYVESAGVVFIITPNTVACEDLLEHGEFLSSIADALCVSTEQIYFI